MPRWTARRFLGLCLVMSPGLLAVGCGDSPPSRVDHLDLAAEMPFAEVLQERPRLELGGAPAGDGVGPALGAGWWAAEGPAAGRYAWGGGDVSELVFPVVSPEGRALELDLRPFSYSDSPAQQVAVSVNGRLVETLVLEPESRKKARIPLAASDAGRMTVRLDWAWARSPREVGVSRDARPLAAALHGARLVDLNANPADAPPTDVPERPSTSDGPRGEDGRLWLPWGTRLDFYVDLPARAWWTAEAAFRGTGRLEVSVVREDDELAALRAGAAVQPSAGHRFEAAKSETLPIEVALDPRPGWARLRLTALGEGERGGVLLGLPRIEREETPAAQTVDRPGTAPARASGAPAAGSDDKAPFPGLVVYSIDTLRADRLGYRGGPVPTPRLDAFAEDAWVFEHLVAQSPWTKASMASAFTGLWPPDHGAINREHRLGDPRVTLAELLHAAGWATAAIVTNPNITETFGFDQGFEHFEYLGEKIPAAEVNEATERFLASRGDDARPLFLWIHTLDPHSPYDPPDAFRQEVLPEETEAFAEGSLDLVNALRAGRRPLEEGLKQRLLDLYHAEVAYADRSFGEFLELLEAHGLGGALVTVLSDHGEEFLEHGNWEHGRALHRESLDVPWIVRDPTVEGRRVVEPAQHLDVLPTLLGRLGLPLPSGLEGHPWLDAGGELSPPDPRPVYSHLHLDGHERASLLDGAFKLMIELRGGRPVRHQLFDVQADPGETRNLAEALPVRTGRLASRLARRLAGADASGRVEVTFDEETRRSLEALGYL